MVGHRPDRVLRPAGSHRDRLACRAGGAVQAVHGRTPPAAEMAAKRHRRRHARTGPVDRARQRHRLPWRAGRHRLRAGGGAADRHRRGCLAVPAVRHRPAHQPHARLRRSHRAARRGVCGPGAAGDQGTPVLFRGGGGGVDAGGGGRVQPGAAAGAARRRPPVQPSPLRRGPDRGGLRRPAAGHGRSRRDRARPGRDRPAGARARAAIAVDRGDSVMTAARARQPRPPWPGAAVAMAVLVVVLLVAGIFASTKTSPASAGSAIGGFALALMFLVMATVGLVVARFQRRNPIGYLLLGAALCFLLTLGAGGYTTLVYAQHRDLPLGAVALVLGPAGILAVFMLPLIVLLFPDGRLPSTRWRPLLVVAFAVAGYALVANEIPIVA